MKRELVRALSREGLPLEAIARVMGEVFGRERPIDLEVFAPQACGSLVFHAERFADVRAELLPLHQAHWDETEGYRHDAGPMDADLEHMQEADISGRLVQFTARAGEKLVGHGRWYVHRSTHTKTPYAGEDALFLLPECRRGRAAVTFLDYMLDSLRTIGLHEFRATSKKANPAGGKLFAHAGFQHGGDQWTLIDKE